MVNVKVESKSAKYKLNKHDLMKLTKGAGVAMGGALVTYLLQLLPNVDFGEYTVVVVGVLSIGLNSLRKLLAGE